jgi:hypothetical protein
MKRTYSCPHCQATLNPGTKVVLRAQREGTQGLFLFSPRPGNYDVIVPDGFALKQQDVVTFGCPVCGAVLTSVHDPAMAEIAFTSANGVSGTVAFSRVAGRHASYFITAERVRSYGEHAEDRGLNFWGAGPER